MSLHLIPAENTYYVCYGDTATHAGVALAGLQTTSGQPFHIIDTDPVAWLELTAHIDMPDLPELPEAGQIVDVGIYSENGRRLICHTAHTRTINSPSDETEYFTLSND